MLAKYLLSGRAQSCSKDAGGCDRGIVETQGQAHHWTSLHTSLHNSCAFSPDTRVEDKLLGLLSFFSYNITSIWMCMSL